MILRNRDLDVALIVSWMRSGKFLATCCTRVLRLGCKFNINTQHPPAVTVAALNANGARKTYDSLAVDWWIPGTFTWEEGPSSRTLAPSARGQVPQEFWKDKHPNSTTRLSSVNSLFMLWTMSAAGNPSWIASSIAIQSRPFGSRGQYVAWSRHWNGDGPTRKYSGGHTHVPRGNGLVDQVEFDLKVAEVEESYTYSGRYNASTFFATTIYTHAGDNTFSDDTCSPGCIDVCRRRDCQERTDTSFDANHVRTADEPVRKCSGSMSLESDVPPKHLKLGPLKGWGVKRDGVSMSVVE
ncbi:hypothetical protein C8J57DRAFT_1222507 [Mycena rebaudengoi]|nr:hypothetical protein C8J57DRAFT_1222507 [Mycena rebaudengoi]